MKQIKYASQNINYSDIKNICKVFPNESIKDCSEIESDTEILVLGHTWFRYQDETSLDEQAENWIKNINDIKLNKKFKNVKKILIINPVI